ncbi:DNA-directed RNA polymerase subunit alpha [bacterium HR15]|nr:DNA-directed RNA polymerase subunit alpha [bacterium HR15]
MVKEMVQTQVRVIRADDNYGKFEIEPLEQGYGTTLGNALRRVLLSSIEGAAITGVRIEGVLHEFDTIPGMKEDVLQFLLNLKNVAIRVNTPHPFSQYTLRMNVQGPGRVHAADIQCPADIEIVNPELYLATLSDVSASINAEIIVEMGRGFVPALKRERERGHIGLIRLNALFNPVRKVNFLVEQTLVGERTDYDRLILEVWTNGAMHPAEAVQRAATILRDQFDLLTTLGMEEMASEIAVSMQEVLPHLRHIPDRPLEELGLSARVINAMRSGGITTLHKLLMTSREQLLELRNFGENALKEVEAKLHELGLELRSEGRRKKAR